MTLRAQRLADTISHFRRLHCIFIVLCLFIPLSLGAAEVEPTPDPLSLKRGWWKKFTTSEVDDVAIRTQVLTKSLRALEEQVPANSRESIKAGVDGIASNIEKFLYLIGIKGWRIEPAPKRLEVYSISELLSAAKLIKQDEADFADASYKLNRLVVILDQSRAKEEELHLSYLELTEKSLQRTLTGLSVMLATTTRAVLEEKVRIAREKLLGIEERSGWNKSLLKEAKERLSSASLNIAELETQISAASERTKNFQKDLLQIETMLIPNGMSGQIDDHSLKAIAKLIIYFKDRLLIISANAQRAIVGLSQEGLTPDQAEFFLENSQLWIQEMDKILLRTVEWKSLVQRQQDAVERVLLQEDSKGADVPGYMAYRRTVHQTLDAVDGLELELFQVRVLAKFVSNNATQNLHWLRGIGQRAFLLVETWVVGIGDQLSYPLFRINESAVTLLKILSSFLILLLAYVASIVLQRMLKTLSDRNPNVSHASMYTFKRVAHYVIMFAGIVWALSALGIDFSSLLIIAGALSVGIGFGLQGIVNNFLGGLIVLFDRKLRVGDFIELSGGEMGHITEVNVQNTVIRTLRGMDILVPNSDIITRQLTNWTLRDQFARLHMPFGVAYGTDKEKVKEVIIAAALNVDATVSNHKKMADPTIWLVGFGESSLDFELVVWVDLRVVRKRASSLRATFLWEIETALSNNGIVIPFPQRDVHHIFESDCNEGEAKN